MNPNDILDAVSGSESSDWEFKSAKGGFPASVWETYSAMANTDGGTIVLGVEQAVDGFEIAGLAKPEQARKTCWDTANNRGKVNRNILREADVFLTTVDGKSVLVIRVPRADRRNRPIYVGQNPMDGTFRRNHEGDYKCQPEEVGRMLADQSEEPADSKILEHFSLADLDAETIRQYRNRFSSRNPNHVWLSEDDVGFLIKLGGWRKDRSSETEGPTVAGLLMFGEEIAIQHVHHGLKFQLDYRERASNSIADRWLDRITLDGTWTPNLFQFFLKVYPKLTSELKLPFGYLDTPSSLFPDPVRIGMSPVHEAIQEALVNSLIHADYRGIGGVIIERFRDRIELSNPGTLLVSIEQLRQGAVSECRNPSLQRMFQMIGAGDKAGSGIDKIRRGWATQQWRSPTVAESTQPDRVKFNLPMVSLIPPESESRLKVWFREDFDALNPIEIQTLVTADLEGEVSNSRLQLVRQEHPTELTKMLQGLASRGFLEQVGQKRGACYRIPIWITSQIASPVAPIPSPIEPLASPIAPVASPIAPVASPIAPVASPVAPVASPIAGTGPAFISTATDPTQDPRLREISSPAREKKKLATSLTRRLLATLCEGRYLSAEHLSQLLDRSKDKLQENFLKCMVEENVLELRYPNQPTHPDQAYRTTPSQRTEE